MGENPSKKSKKLCPEQEESVSVEDTPSNSSKKKDKKETKKGKKHDAAADAADAADADADDKNATEENKVKEDRKRKREEKKQLKAKLLEQVPKVDADGISYTKAQIRRMMRRVKRGLPPVPTPEEEAELKRHDKKLREEEALQFAGLMDNKQEDDNDDGSDGSDKDVGVRRHQEHDDDNDDEEEEDEDEEDAGKTNETNRKNQHDEEKKEAIAKARAEQQDRPTKKHKVSNKPVPKDYVCQACQNKHDFPHWIYDCPDKVTMRGTNQVSASGHDNAPSAKKVFVSGLPFDAKPADVKAMFQSACCDAGGKVTSLKLLKFPDTGRCKGQAFVVFDTEESARKAILMTGTKIPVAADDSNSSNKTKKNKKKDSDVSSKRELELKVTKVKSRSVTKAKALYY